MQLAFEVIPQVSASGVDEVGDAWHRVTVCDKDVKADPDVSWEVAHQ